MTALKDNRIRIISLLLLTAFFVLSARKCKEGTSGGDDAQKAEKAYGEEIFRLWIHSLEEDEDDIQVYRPKDYPFPLRRGGRDGFKINRDGSFFFYTTGPADKPELSSKGNWSLDKQVLRVKYEGTAHEGIQAETKMEVVSLKNGVLKVKKF